MTYIERVNTLSASLSVALDTATKVEIGDSEVLALMIGKLLSRADKRNDKDMVNALNAAHAHYLDVQYPSAVK